MSVLERYPSYRESNKRSKERQGLTLGVRFTGVRLTEVSVKRESTVYLFQQKALRQIFHMVLFAVDQHLML